jgi:hypothetical protein
LATSYDDAYRLKEELKPDYQARHQDFWRLRQFWHGKYWDLEAADQQGITSLFKDITRQATDVGPDIKLVHNVLQEACVKFQTFLSPLPMIRQYVDPPESPTKRAQATKKERFLYGTWSENRMAKLNADIAWYLPLFGSCFFGAFPDFRTSTIRAVLRSPENAYPIPSFDGTGLHAVVFCWNVRESWLAREYPEYVRRSDRNKGRYRFLPKKTKSSDPEVEFLEFSDNNEWARWADGQKLNGIEHKYGFNLFDQMDFIRVPNEPWGHGAVEQIAGLTEAGNALYSLVFQSVMDQVFPTLVLTDPAKAPETIERGAGAVIPLNAGGRADYLVTPGAGTLIGGQLLSENERMIKQGASMPDVNFGQFNASIVTGKAINELQGAGTGSTVEMVQGVGIGSGLVSFNEKAIYMTQTLFRDDTINLHGVRPGSHIDLEPQRFALSLKGKDLIGSGRNEVVFSPHIGSHDKLVMGLQGLGGGLWSKKHVREQMGIPDNEAMEEEILSEVVSDAVMGAIVQALQADPVENADDVARAGGQFLETGHPHPLLALPAAPAAGMGPPPGGPAALPAQLPPPPGGAPGGAPPAQSSGTLLNDVVAAFQQGARPAGRVFLVGEIVVTGQTDDEIEVALTDGGDRQGLVDALPMFRGRLRFHSVDGEPDEPFVEVTPGSDPVPQGLEAAAA